MCLCISIGFKTRVGFLYGSLILVLSLIFKFDQLLSLLLRINVSRIYSLIFEHICFPAAIYAAYACAISQQFLMRLHWLCFINFARQRYTIGTWPTPIADYSLGFDKAIRSLDYSYNSYFQETVYHLNPGRSVHGFSSVRHIYQTIWVRDVQAISSNFHEHYT